MKTTALAFAAAIASAPAAALTGNEFLAMYETDKAASLQYVAGMIDGMNAMQYAEIRASKRDENFKHWCPSGTITYLQYHDVLVKRLRDRPDGRHHPASGIAYFAFKDAWPCEKK